MRVIHCFFCSAVPPTRDRVAPEERGEHSGGDADVDAGHALAHPVDVEGAAAHSAVLLGDEQKLDAELAAAHLVDHVGRELVALVEVEQDALGQLPMGELLDRAEDQLEGLEIETDAGVGAHGFPCSGRVPGGAARDPV